MLIALLWLATAATAAPLSRCPSAPSGWTEIIDKRFVADDDYRICQYRRDGADTWAAENEDADDCNVHASFEEGSDWAERHDLTMVEGIPWSAEVADSVSDALNATPDRDEGCSLLIRER